MRGSRCLTGFLAVVLTCLFSACADDEAPTAPTGPELDFALEVPERILGKRVVPVTARLIRASRVEFPLTFVFEKQNTGEPSFVTARRSIDESFEGEITIKIAARMDPRVRVTLTEAGARGLTVTKSARIDVLTFP